jgi:hypothetical protein
MDLNQSYIPIRCKLGRLLYQLRLISAVASADCAALPHHGFAAGRTSAYPPTKASHVAYAHDRPLKTQYPQASSAHSQFYERRSRFYP